MNERLVFANQLRGVAALFVAVIHYTVAYQTMRPAVAWVIAAPPLDGPVHPLASLLFPRWFDGGAFGVALFFLISGFVIPFSLAATSRTGFLLARALRIFPTFWIALLVEWLAVGASAAHWHRPIVFDWPVFLRNALLVNTLYDGVNVDFVSWTLNVEVKFYVLMALLRPLVLRGRLWPFLCVAAGAVWITWALIGHLPPLLLQEAMYIVFMLAGTALHYHHRHWLDFRRTAALCAVLLGAAGLCWAIGPAAELWPYKPANYAYAFAAFCLAYRFRSRFARSRLLDGLAAISYPLYLVHALLGFTLMSLLIIRFQVPYLAAALVAFVVSVAAAWLLHVTVERRSLALGQRLTRRFAPRERAGAPAAAMASAQQR